MPKQPPKFTVIFNIPSNEGNGGFVGTAWQFFWSEERADAYIKALNDLGWMTYVKRPYFHSEDWNHLHILDQRDIPK